MHNCQRTYELKHRANTYRLDALGQLTGIKANLPGAGSFPGDALCLGFQLGWRGSLPALLSPGVAQTLESEESPAGVKLMYAYNQAALKVQVSVDTIGPHWQVQLTNNSEHVLDSFAFQLQGAWQGPAAPTCTIPLLAGWALPLGSLAAGDELNLAYPVRASMQWIDLYNADTGLYLGVHDPLPFYKQLTVERAGDLCQITWRLCDLDLAPGMSFELPPVYLALHAGDWHSAADIYRSWAQDQYAPPAVPAWYADNPAWAWTGLRGQYEPAPWHTTADLPAISAQAEKVGVTAIQLTAYNELGHDTLYPDFRVGASNGGETGMRRAVAQIHQAGGRITIYANGRIVDPASSLTPAQRADWAVRTPESQVARETYGQVTFDILCPGAAEWRELFIGRLAHLVQAYGIDGIFIDQVSAATSLPCYASRHDHTAPNEAWAYYRVLLRDLRVRLKQLNPDLVLFSEGISDVFGQYLDAQQAHQDWPVPLQPKTVPLTNLFRYTFPGYLLNSGCITADAGGYHYLKVAHLLGSGFDIGIADLSKLSPEMSSALRFALQWHRRWAAQLRAAPNEIPTRQTGLQANSFAESKETVVPVNLAWLPEKNQSEPAEFELDLPLADNARLVRVQLYTPDGELPIDWTADDSRVHMRLPFTELGGLVINCTAD
ncbi:MAG: DUF6259 domain-containing protein [Anaerolineae bacterium]